MAWNFAFAKNPLSGIKGFRGMVFSGLLVGLVKHLSFFVFSSESAMVLVSPFGVIERFPWLKNPFKACNDGKNK